MDLAAAQGPAAFMARVVAQILVSRGIRVVIISSNLVKVDSSSSSQAIKASEAVERWRISRVYH